MELDERIIVDEVVQLPRPHYKAGDDLTPVQGLFRVVNHAAFDQRNNAVAEHLSVDAQVIELGQVVQDRIGNGADPELQRRAVLYQVGDVPGDPAGQLVRFTLRSFQYGTISWHQHVDVTHVNEAITQHAGQLGVHFGDHHFGRLRRRLDDVRGDAVAAVSVFVGRADGDYRYVNNRPAGAEQRGNL